MATLVTDSERKAPARLASGAIQPKAPARLASGAILSAQSDERLVQLVRDGHERAFDAIVDRYRRPLVRFCARILPESRTEDAVQQAFINAHSALLASDEPLQLKPWLYTIARNAALNMLRQNGWNYEQIPADFDGVMRPDQAVEQKIRLERTVAAVNDLPARQRDAIVMREFEGRSYEEIASMLGTGDGAVRQLLNRARSTLRTVATAVIPPPLVTRAAASMSTSDGRRVAEVISGLGAAGVVKVGATAVVAGSLVVGAIHAPLSSHHESRPAARPHAQQAAIATAARPPLRGLAAPARHDAANPGTRHHAAHGLLHAPSAPGRHHSSPSGQGGERGGSGESHSGRGGSGDSASGSGGGGSGTDRSGPGSDGSATTQAGTDDSSTGGGSSASGPSAPSADDSVTSTSGSGMSGSTSGSGTSGSGTSGSGSSDASGSGSGTSTTSGSGSGTSGSGTSGSGTSGSGTSGPSGTSGTSGSGKLADTTTVSGDH